MISNFHGRRQDQSLVFKTQNFLSFSNFLEIFCGSLRYDLMKWKFVLKRFLRDSVQGKTDWSCDCDIHDLLHLCSGIMFYDIIFVTFLT